jgi:hypothetical protein
MAKLSKEFKEKIHSLSKEEMEKIVLNLSRKDKGIYEKLFIEYVRKDSVQDLFEEVKATIEHNLFFPGRGIIQKQLAKSLGKSIKTINHFRDVTRNHKLEADLLLFTLQIIFDNFESEFGTCWTVFDSKVAITTNRLLNLVRKKLHEDYWIEYETEINRFLKILKNNCSHLDYVFTMPGRF